MHDSLRGSAMRHTMSMQAMEVARIFGLAKSLFTAAAIVRLMLCVTLLQSHEDGLGRSTSLIVVADGQAASRRAIC